MPDAVKHEIPTIDFSAFLQGNESERVAVATRVGQAAEAYGFMSLVGHGIPQSIVDDTFNAAAAFFDLPIEEKLRIQEQRTNRGYQPMFDNIHPNQKPSGSEAFSMGHPEPPSDPSLLDLPFYAQTPWPENDDFHDRLKACYWALYKLSRDVLQCMAMHLEKPVDFFDRVSGNTYSNMRVIHYPPAETIADVTDVGVRPHEDQGLITLLVQDMNGGLSVLGPDKEWLPVLPDPNAIVLNVAKLMTRWTNGRYRSAVHMVVNRSGRERYSIPLFVHPDYHQVIDPKDFAGEGEELRFEPIIAGEQVYANFAKQRVSWQEADDKQSA